MYKWYLDKESESCDASPDQGQGDQKHISMLKNRCDYLQVIS
jgi:hypothetical protein